MIWLVIACPGSRADELGRCLGSLRHDTERTVVVTAQHHDPLPRAAANLYVDRGEDFALTRLWNRGLTHAYNEGATHVAVLASDTIGHPGSLPILAAAMDLHGWAMAGPTSINGGHTRTLPERRTAGDRVPGACFMLDARHRLYCDERYRWWYGDDDLEMQARECGPVGVLDGTGLELSQPDTALDADRQRWATEDRAMFVAKWGREPW